MQSLSIQRKEVFRAFEYLNKPYEEQKQYEEVCDKIAIFLIENPCLINLCNISPQTIVRAFSRNHNKLDKAYELRIYIDDNLYIKLHQKHLSERKALEQKIEQIKLKREAQQLEQSRSSAQNINNSLITPKNKALHSNRVLESISTVVITKKGKQREVSSDELFDQYQAELNDVTKREKQIKQLLDPNDAPQRGIEKLLKLTYLPQIRLLDVKCIDDMNDDVKEFLFNSFPPELEVFNFGDGSGRIDAEFFLSPVLQKFRWVSKDVAIYNCKISTKFFCEIIKYTSHCETVRLRNCLITDWDQPFSLNAIKQSKIKELDLTATVISTSKWGISQDYFDSLIASIAGSGLKDSLCRIKINGSGLDKSKILNIHKNYNLRNLEFWIDDHSNRYAQTFKRTIWTKISSIESQKRV